MQDDISEEWRPMIGWPTYEVSNLGKIRRTVASRTKPAGYILKQPPDRDGYPHISLYKHGKHVSAKVHSLVCEAFHGQRPTLLHEVAHEDGNPSNVQANNLRWDTRAGNHADKLRHGTHNRGERHGLSLLSNKQAAAAIA